jgi:MMPL family
LAVLRKRGIAAGQRKPRNHQKFLVSRSMPSTMDSLTGHRPPRPPRASGKTQRHRRASQPRGKKSVSLTRAVIFSAMTTAVAFGSMWASSYPGMSSMGKLMALALVCTMAAAVLFQPVLMGRPRQVNAHPEQSPNLREVAE